MSGGVGAVITGNQISVFVQNPTLSVWMDQWNGSSWQWTQLGVPQTAGGAIGVCDGGGAVNYSITIDVFIGDCDGSGHLWVDQWNGSFWQWYDQGHPPGPNYQNGAGAVSSGISLYVFFVASDWYLWVDYWNGSSWQRSKLGSP